MNKMQFGGRVRCGLDRTLAALRDLRTLRGRMSDLALTLVAGAVLFVGASMAPASPASPWYYECYGWDYWSDCDGDGVVNGQDNCPYEYGSYVCNGCPDWQCDSDGDGVPNNQDNCPNEYGSSWNCNGCPDWQCDSDGDGIPNSQDSCPNEYGSSPTCNGCPDWQCDSDGDGVPNSQDGCPNEYGSWNCGGCPSYCGSCTFTDCNDNGVADACDLQTQSYGNQILRDGDFEQAVFNGCPSPCQTSCGFTLPEWTHGGITEDLIRNQDGCGYPNPSGGEYYVSLQGSVCCGCDNNGSISQNLLLVPGATYRLSMDVFLDPYDAIRVQVDGQEYTFDTAIVPAYTWYRAEWSFSPSAKNVTLTISSTGTKDAPGCLEASYCNIDNMMLQKLDWVAVDLNNNGQPDSCDVVNGTDEDCDQNGVVDSYQQGLNALYAVESGQLGPIGYTSPRSADLAAPPYSLGDVLMRIEGFGDFSSASEYVTVYLNGRYVGKAFYNQWVGKNDCSWMMADSLILSRDFYNEAIGNGSSSTSAIFEFRPTIAVNANQCPTGSWIKVHLDYTAAVTEDCNANGLLDACETRDFPDTDANHNGIVDACEDYSLVFECAGDLDGSRAVDTGDMSLLLMNFGYAMPGDPNDLDANGHIDTADVSLLLLSFGPCQ